MNITIIFAAVLAILIILALLGYAEMARSAEANQDHWQHD